jgi:hypothetical protein
MKKFVLIFSFMVISFFGVTYAISDNDDTQEVQIDSYPKEATVVIDNKNVGKTPLTIFLSTEKSHRVRVKKAGYHIASDIFISTEIDKSSNFLFYKRSQRHKILYPPSLNIELKSEFLPKTKGSNPFNELTEHILKIELMREKKELSEEDYQYNLKKLFEFYQK